MGKVTKFQRKGKSFTATTSDQTFKGKAAIIATGVMPKRLNVPGEEEFLGHGVSYSTVSHAPLFIDMDVAVIGDGMPAIQAAAELAQIAKKVSVIGVANKLIASPLGMRIKDSGRAEFFTGCTVKEIRGNTSPEKIIIKTKTGEIEIPVKGVFIELGYVPNTAMFSCLAKLTEKKESSSTRTIKRIFPASSPRAM